MQRKAEVSTELFYRGENKFPCSAQSCGIIYLNKVKKNKKKKCNGVQNIERGNPPEKAAALRAQWGQGLPWARSSGTLQGRVSQMWMVPLSQPAAGQPGGTRQSQPQVSHASLGTGPAAVALGQELTAPGADMRKRDIRRTIFKSCTRESSGQ